MANMKHLSKEEFMEMYRRDMAKKKKRQSSVDKDKEFYAYVHARNTKQIRRKHRHIKQGVAP